MAMGTSLPETAVSVTAAVTGNNALAVSNAVGSNIFNLMVVVGACTLFTSVAVQINTLKIDFPISILCAVLLLILGAAGMSLGHIDGVVFIILFLAFILYMSAQHRHLVRKMWSREWKRKSIFWKRRRFRKCLWERV